MAEKAHTTTDPEIARLRGSLFALQIEAGDTRLLAAAATHSVGNIFRCKVPAGQDRADVFLLDDGDRDLLHFNAERLEVAVRAVVDGLTDLCRIASSLSARPATPLPRSYTSAPAPESDPLFELVSSFRIDRTFREQAGVEIMDDIRQRIVDGPPPPRTVFTALIALRLANDEMEKGRYVTAQALLSVAVPFLDREFGR